MKQITRRATTTVPNSSTSSHSPSEVGAAIEQFQIEYPLGTDNLRSLVRQTEYVQPQHDPRTTMSPQRLIEDVVVPELTVLYDEYSFITAKDASLTDERQRDTGSPQQHSSDDNDSLVYGEIDLQGFCTLLREIIDRPTTVAAALLSSGGIFYDLGSGSGRAVFAARFVGDYSTCIGLELLANLHGLASAVHSLYKVRYASKLQHRAVQFIETDLLDYDWSDGTVVYIPNLLFDPGMLQQIATQATKLQRGAYVLSLKKLGSVNATTDDHEENTTEEACGCSFQDAFELLRQQVVTMSWGDSTVYIYQRR